MTNEAQKSIHWTELDVLRGLAALMMILNHLGYKTLAPNLVDSGQAGSLLFISSFAPVLFFFVLISLRRYLVGLLIHSHGYDQFAWGVLNWILGTKDRSGVSYPLSPWIAYPFAGYIIGVGAMRYRGFIETHRWRVVSGLLMLGGL